MAATEEQIEELIELSIKANNHEDTLLLIITKYAAKPLSKDMLLEHMNEELLRHNKTLWNEEDLDISLGLLTQKGLLERIENK